jgi:hypothetical protein
MEDMITEHLDACLLGESRVRHRLYNDKKVQVLFKALLEDTGYTPKIQDLIKQVNDYARRKIDEDEREARRVAANREREASLEEAATNSF